MAARSTTIDFSKADNIRLHSSGNIQHRGNAGDLRPMSAEGKLLTPKQIRARARRAAKKKRKGTMSNIEFETLYKPIEEWDIEELARGRPRNVDGDFRGRKPGWITREVHERCMEQFQLVVKQGMNTQAVTALDTLQWVLGNDELDDRGKPLVPASVKLQASTFLVEHVVGKPKQQIQQDISVKLQGILGSVMVNPDITPGNEGEFELAHYPGRTIPIGLDKDDDVVDGEVVDEEFDEWDGE